VSSPAVGGSAGPSGEPSTGPAGGSGTSSSDLGGLGALVPNSTDAASAPAGFASHRDSAGWSAAVPTGWRISDRGTRTTATAPSGTPDLLVDSQPKAGPSALGAWRSLEPSVRASSPGYRLLSMRAADGGDGTTAAVWEFTFTSGGRTMHVVDFGLVRNGHGYGLRWRAPQDQWPAALEQMRTVFASFRPGP